MSNLITHSVILSVGLIAGAWLGHVSLSNPGTPPKVEIATGLPAPSPVTKPISLDDESDRPSKQREDPWLAFETPGGILRAWDGFLTWLESQPAEHLGQSLDAHADTITELDLRYLIARIHLLHWADGDLESALAHAGQLPEEHARHALLQIHSAWARRDSAAALTSANAQPQNRGLTRGCLQVQNYYHPQFDLAWAGQAGIDPAAHVRLWLRRGDNVSEILEATLAYGGLTDADRAAALERLFKETAWATRRDVTAEEALDLFERVPEDPAELREAARQGLLGGWANHANPLAALKAVHSLTGNLVDPQGSAPMPPPSEGRSFSSMGLLTEAMSAYPDETIRWLLEDLDRETRAAALERIYSSGDGNKEHVGWLELFEALPPDERPSIGRLSSQVYDLSHERPRELLDWVAGFPWHESADESGRTRVDSLTHAAVQTIASQNPDEALARLEAMEEGPVRQAVISGLIKHFSRTQAETARELLDELADEKRRQYAEATWIAAHVDRAGLDAGVDYLEKIDDPEARTAVVEALLSNNGLEPSKRALLVDRYCQDQEDPLRSAYGLIDQWAERDPVAASEWFTQYDHSPSYLLHIKSLLERWRFQDFDAAAAFAQTLPPGEGLDLAIARLAGMARVVDPHAALQWQARMSDPEKRFQALETSLARVDELAAHPGEMWDALDSVPISEPERTVLRERLQK